MNRLFPILILLSLAATGCASRTEAMVNPQTGTVANCSATGVGWLGAPVALISVQNCIENYRKSGFVSMDEYIAQGGNLAKVQQQGVRPQIVFSTDKPGADIYAGPLDQKNFVKLANKAPMIFTANPGFGFWNPECYKAIHDDKESNTICRDQQEVMREIHFTWTE